MFEKIKHSFSEHPYLWSGGVFVVGAILVYLLFGGKSSSSGTTVTGTATDPNAAAYASEYAAQLQSADQQAAISAQSSYQMAAINATATQSSIRYLF